MTRTIWATAMIVGCGGSTEAPKSKPNPPAAEAAPSPKAAPTAARDADYRLLFVGNSHTHFHGLPELVAQAIRHCQPGKKVYYETVSVGFLDDLAGRTDVRQSLQRTPWTTVVLQAQKISESGKYRYSTETGVAFAKEAKAAGARVLFFSEWAMKGKPDTGTRAEEIYREMARAADGEVAAVNRAWDRALAVDPGLPLHSDDGNHQSELGAFLTACALTKAITGKSVASLVDFPSTVAEPKVRRILVEAANAKD